MATVKEIADTVRAVGTRLENHFNVHGWSKNVSTIQFLGSYYPGPSLNFILEHVEHTAQRIEGVSNGQLKIQSLSSFLAGIPDQVGTFQFTAAANDPDAVIGATMTMLNTILARVPLPPPPSPPPPKVDWEDISKEPDQLPKDLVRRLRSIDARLKTLEPRSKEAKSKIDEIDAAHEVAIQLPTDIEDLSAQRDRLKHITEDAKKLAAEIEHASETAESETKRIATISDQAEQAIKRSEDALRGSTGVGLANAFEQRKVWLTVSAVCWVVGLICALSIAVGIGADRVTVLKDVLISDRSATVIWVNALLAALGIGAPVWFAWLSTKQVGANFKLAEDYAFKAAVSKAYEGYRKEAIELDPSMRERLFNSALLRLEQEPLRLVDKTDHSSPLQEALSSPALQKFWDRVPGLYDDVITLVRNRSGGGTQ